MLELMVVTDGALIRDWIDYHLLLFLTRACCVYFLYFYAILHVMLRRNARVTGIVLGVLTATRSHGARVSRTFILSCNTTKIKVLFN